MKLITSLVLVLSLLNLSGCVVFNRYFPDKSRLYQKAEVYDEVNVPQGLDSDRIHQLMPIPKVAESLRNLPLPEDVVRPAPLKVELLVSGIQKRRAGDSQWLFIDRSASQVWPELSAFVEAKKLDTQSFEATRGIVQTLWLDNTHSYIQERGIALKDGEALRFKVDLKPGLQRNTSRIFVVVDQNKKGGSSFPEVSEDLELQENISNDLVQYLGDAFENKNSVSLLAQQNQRQFEVLLVKANTAELEVDSKAELMASHLFINQSFNQSWYLVGKAIREAGLPLFDINRSARSYFINQEDKTPETARFQRKLANARLSRSGKKLKRFTLILDESEDGVRVFLKAEKDDVVIDEAFSEFVLNLIKEKM